jgi:hypothetical protein
MTFIVLEIFFGFLLLYVLGWALAAFISNVLVYAFMIILASGGFVYVFFIVAAMSFSGTFMAVFFGPWVLLYFFVMIIVAIIIPG